MYYIRRNPEMLAKFLSDEDRLLREFMRDSSPSNQKLYKLFKVEKSDLNNYLESIKPVKRERSPYDPYFHKLKFRKYHAKVHKTEEI